MYPGKDKCVISYGNWIVWPVCSGHPTFGRVRYKEAVPPVYIGESRPKSAIVEIALPTQRKDPYV